MRKRRNTILTAAIVVTGSFGANSLLAHEENRQEPMEGQGMHDGMMQGGMHGMMGMMSDMDAMMEKCNAMMGKIQQAHESDTNA